MNHSAYCMMVRTFYNLFKKDNPKKASGSMKPKIKPPTVSLRGVSEAAAPYVRTENSMRRKNANGELPDSDIQDWCFRSLSRKRLAYPDSFVQFELSSLGCFDTLEASRRLERNAF